MDKILKANDLRPAFPTHPGEILKDEIESRGLSQRILARRMGIAYSALNEILNAHRPLTEKTALLFEAALDVDADALMRLQLKFNMRLARNNQVIKKRIETMRQLSVPAVPARG